MMTKNDNWIAEQLKEAADTLQIFISDEKNLVAIKKAGEIMLESLRNGGKIISCGNGGSMCDAMHFAEELSGRFRENRPAIAAVSISDPSHLTCVGNDFGFEYVFSRYLEALGKKGDVLLAISTSGNSSNVIKAAEYALKNEIYVVALTGKNGGTLSQISNVEIRAPFSAYADRVQEIHIKVIHSLIGYIEQNL
jgi:D-sedoheptulose 7-phosphate isomerase